MSTENLHALAALTRRERDTLLARWREEVRQLAVAHELDVPTLNDHVPDLLEELADELEAHTDESMVGELKKNSVVHGLDLPREERGTIASQTKSTRRLDRTDKREADNRMAGRDKAVERWEGEGGALRPAKKGERK